MKNVFNYIKKSITFDLYAVCLFATVFAFISCDVGLGESVDTQAPTIEITYPPVSAVIRDKFVLAGTWEDDKLINSITVSVMNSSTREEVFSTGDVLIDANKSWSVELNNYDADDSSYYNGWQFSDGTYQVTVVAHDAAGHTSGQTSRTFDIDNTPPVFVISSPGVTREQVEGGSEPKAYGTALKVSGRLSDSSAVNYSKLEVYDEDVSKVVAEVESDYEIEKGDTASVVLSRYIKGEASSYDNIFGPVSDDVDRSDLDSLKKTFYAKLYVSDSARKYTDPAGKEVNSDDKGNMTSVFWINDEIKELFSTSSYGLDVSALTKIVNGTYVPSAGTSISAVEVEKVKEILKKKVDTASDSSKYLAFSLNPYAAPTYVVNSFSAKGWTAETFGEQSASKGSAISATVARTAVNNPPNLEPVTMKMWLHRVGALNENSSKNSVDTAIKELCNIVGNKKLSEKEIKTKASENGWILIKDNSSYTGQSVDSDYTFSTTISTPITTGEYYIVVVTGEDQDGSQAVASTADPNTGYFGFVGAQGLPPAIESVKMTTDSGSVISSQGYAASTADVNIAVRATADNEIDKADFTVTVKEGSTTIGTAVKKDVPFAKNENDEDGNPRVDVGTATITLDEILAENTDVNLKLTADSEKLYSYTIDILVKDTGGNSNTAKEFVNIDSKKPKINITSVGPTVLGYNAEGTKVEKVSLNGTVSIRGNITEDNIKDVRYELYIDGTKLSADSLGATLQISKDVHTAMYMPSANASIRNGAKLKVKLIAEDIVGNISEYDSITYNIDDDNPSGLDFIVDQNTDKPVITLSQALVNANDPDNVPEENFFKTDGFIKGTVTDDDALKEVIVRVFDKDGNDLGVGETYSANNKPSKALNYPLNQVGKEGLFKFEIEANDSTYNSAEDDLNLTVDEKASLGAAKVSELAKTVQGYRTSKTAQFYIAIDNAAPVVKETASDSGKNTVYMKSGSVTLSGTIVETNGLESVKIDGVALTDAGTTADGDGTYWLSNASTGTYSWKKTFNFDDEPAKYTNGSRTVTIIATDVVGKASSSVSVTISDEAAPVITEASSVNATKTIEFTGGAVTLSGTVVEENGLDSLKIADEVLEFSDVADVDGKYWETATAGIYGFKKTFVVKLADFTNGSRSFKIEATDIAGKSSAITPIAADTKAPVVTETAVTGELVAGVTKLTVNENRTDGTFTVAGTITEINGISGVTLHNVALTKADVADGDGTYWVTDASTGTYAYKKTFITGSSNSSAANYLADGNYSLEIKATDTVGNIGNKSVSVTVDTTKPVWGKGSTDEGSAGYDKTIAAPHVSTQASESGWYRVDELKISGSVSDNLTGIEKVEYSLDENAGTVGASGITWTELSGTNSWSGSIAGLSTGKVIYLRATDIAGNVSPIEKITGLKIDTDEPTIDAASRKTKFTNSTGYSNGAEVLSNKKDSIDVVFNVMRKDNGSGIKAVYISTAKTLATDFNNGTPAAALDAAGLTAEGLTATDGYTTYKVTVAKTAIVSGAVYAFAYDNAGNYSRENLFTISVDETAPTVELNVPVDADVSTTDKTDVNKVIILNGTASDETKLDSIVRLEYNTTSAAAADSAWTELTSSNGGDGYALSGSYSFTAVGFDTSKFIDKSSIYVRAVAIDDAGNLGYSNVVTLYVNQDSDRPQVKINNLNNNENSFILKYGTNAQVTGTLSDDDSTSTATVSKFIVSETEYDGTGSEPANIATYTPATGDFTIQPADTEDGIKTFYIYIEDNNGGRFYTTATAASYMENPKISVKGTAVEESVNTAAFSYSSDGSNPIAQLGEGLPYASNTGTPAVAKDDNGNDFVLSTDSKTTDNATLNSSFKAGGISRRYVKLHFVATDASGIEGMTLEISNEKGESVKKLTTHEKIGDLTMTGFTVDGTFTANGNKGTWDTGFIDLNGVLSGQCTVKLTPYDKAGLAGNGAYSFYVDNDAPEIVVRMPANGERVTGDVSISGSANDRGTAGTVNIQWRIPATAEVTTASSKSGAAKLEYLKGLKWNGGISSLAVDATVNSWQFDFDGKYDPATSTVVSSSSTDYSYNAGNPNLTEFDKADFAQNSDHTTTSLYKLPIYFMATDNLGNYSVKEDFIIEHNPDGDKPNLKFSYPTKDDYDVVNEILQNYVTLGGTIRVTGGAEIPSGTTTVKAVYYQIADASASFNATDKAKASQAINMDAQGKNQGGYGLTVVDAYTVINSIAGTSYTTSNPPADPTVYGFKTKALMDEWWGIRANGGASWNVVLNDKSELNPKTSGTTNNIALRACGVNAEGKFGAWTTGADVIAIHIDDTAPTIAVAVNKYGDGTSAITAVPLTAPTASHTYESDMYLKGNWTLALDVLDETAVTNVTVKKGNTVLTENTDYYKASYNPTGKSGYKVYIPISRTDSSVEYTVTAQDSNHLATQSFSFNIDEIAPTLDSLTGNGTAFDSDDFTSIENNNYVFTVGGKSLDEGSGVERIVFYYMRKSRETKTSISNQVILDPMIATSGSNYEDAKVALSGLTKLDVKQGANTYSLYAKNYSGSATTESFTSGSAYDAHVRVGGLIFIDGAYRKITAMSGNTVDFTPSLTEAKASVTASFPIAQVIDNSATEKTLSDAANPFTFEKGDDGDLMPESFSKSGKTWTWDASIHSDNMPDGPVSLVILAFDAAGNVNGTTINTKITNNAPRLAKVFLGTDLSGDGKYSNTDSLEEIVTYNILAAEGKEQSAYTLDFTEKNDKNQPKFPAGVFKIKNGLAVIPEFTGGNGEIGMILNASATDATAKTGTVTTPIATGSVVPGTDEDGNAVDTVNKSFSGTTAGSVNATFEGSAVTNKMYAYNIAKASLGTDAAAKGMSFTFWDSTEETTRGTDSQYSVLYVKNFNVAQNDTVAPTVVINPFWWNKIDDNSIYDSTSASKFSDLKGHIELEKDWIATDSTGKKLTSYDGNSSGTYLDSDPKVSGKVRFTGTAYDNVRLKSIAITFSNISGTAVATYDKTTSSWTVPATTLESQGYVFSVSDATKDAKGNSVYYGNYEDDVYFGQKGHKIYWTLDIDTAKITDVAAKDISLIVKATDDANKTTANSTASNLTADKNARIDVVDGTTNVSSYRVDVVPYVTNVITALSKKKKSNPSVANRTALGHYPVQTVVKNMDSAMNNTSSETITLEGFNLYHSSATVTGITTVTPTAPTATTLSKLSFNVAELASGKLTVTVNSIPVINNLNNNDASGSAKTAGTNNVNWYNRIGNGDNNNTLTDDLIFDVWEFNDKAAVPFSGTVGGTKMKINQVSGQPNFAFTNGNLWWNMGGNVNANEKPSGDFSSYYWSAGYDCLATVTVGFHVDELGYTYGSGAGGDSNTSDPPAIDSYTMWVQRWGLGSQDARSTYGTSNGYVTNGAALEKVGQKETVGDKTVYSMNKQRIQSPEFASATNGTNTNLYHAYYDAMNDEIRFKAGTIKGKKNDSTGQFKDQYCSKNGEGAQEYNIDNVQVVASRSISGRGPGKYLGIAVAKNGTTDVVVMVWYDAYENQMLYSYKSDPVGNLNSKDATAAGWSPAKVIFDEGGEWCQVAVDANNHIHIAAFAGDGDVKYAYLDNYASTDVKTCTVDADGTVGEHLTLDVALDAAGNSIPYIGYYSSTHKKPKYAYVVDTSAPAPAGVDENDMFTGAWEVTVVPCYSNMIVNQEEKINIGVWKYTADTTIGEVTYKKGQIKNSTTGRSSYYSATGTSLYNGTNWSKTYGNGTANGMLAYQVQNGSGSCIETAQMR